MHEKSDSYESRYSNSFFGQLQNSLDRFEFKSASKSKGYHIAFIQFPPSRLEARILRFDEHGQDKRCDTISFNFKRAHNVYSCLKSTASNGIESVIKKLKEWEHKDNDIEHQLNYVGVQIEDVYLAYVKNEKLLTPLEEPLDNKEEIQCYKL